MPKQTPRDTRPEPVPSFRDPAALPRVAPAARPPAPRRAVPEPPRPKAGPPKPVPLPAPPTADVIPITRARTTPPRSFNASASGWDLPRAARNPAGSLPAFPPPADPTIVDRRIPIMGPATSAAPKLPPAPVAAPVAARPAPAPVVPAPVVHAPPVTAPKQPTPLPLPAPVETAPVLAAPGNQWAVFEALGLGPPKNDQKKHNYQKTIVSAYRALGFGILTIIVLVLLGYIATSAFYFVSDSWIQPMKVSRTDERVLQLEAQLVEQQNVRDRILADLAHADRYIAVQQSYQAEFADAIRADLSGRQRALDRVRGLAEEYAGARQKIQRSNAAYASSSRRKMAQEYAAGLIDRNDMLSGKFQLAQISSSNLSLAERQAEYEQRAAELEAEAAALDAILSESGGDGALSYDVLKIKQEYELSRLETAKAIEMREALKASLERQDAVIGGLRQSPWLRAIADDANVAFVPYENLDNVSKGSDVYGCALEMFWCDDVGNVIEVLPGEVTFKHPHREKILRGQMVVIDLDEADAAEDDVLFVGGKPLLL